MRTTNLDEASSAPFDFALTRRPEFSSGGDLETAPSATRARKRIPVRVSSNSDDTSSPGTSGYFFTIQECKLFFYFKISFDSFVR